MLKRLFSWSLFLELFFSLHVSIFMKHGADIAKEACGNLFCFWIEVFCPLSR
jgi:hypothetical protein